MGYRVTIALKSDPEFKHSISVVVPPEVHGYLLAAWANMSTREQKPQRYALVTCDGGALCVDLLDVQTIYTEPNK